MSGMEGLEAHEDGPARWRIVETGRPGSDGMIGAVTRDAEGGFVVEVEGGPPPGPYGTIDDAVQSVAMWRLARFRGDRP